MSALSRSFDVHPTHHSPTPTSSPFFPHGSLPVQSISPGEVAARGSVRCEWLREAVVLVGLCVRCPGACPDGLPPSRPSRSPRPPLPRSGPSPGPAAEGCRCPVRPFGCHSMCVCVLVACFPLPRCASRLRIVSPSPRPAPWHSVAGCQVARARLKAARWSTSYIRGGGLSCGEILLLQPHAYPVSTATSVSTFPCPPLPCPDRVRHSRRHATPRLCILRDTSTRGGVATSVSTRCPALDGDLGVRAARTSPVLFVVGVGS